MSIVRLDLDALVKAGGLSAEEAARLTGLALPDRRRRLYEKDDKPTKANLPGPGCSRGA